MSIYRTSLETTRPEFIKRGRWILKNLTDISVVFGRNGLGKSILLRSILNQDKKNRHYASPERSGEIEFQPKIMQTELNPEVRANRRQQNLAATYRQEVVSRLQAFLAKRGNIREDPIPLSPDMLEPIISELLPQFEFKITGENPPYKLVRSETKEAINTVTKLSSGESEIFAIALDVITICAIWELDHQDERILLLDEPDLHLHPELQQNLAKFLVAIVDKFSVQIIIATHSTTLLSALGFHGGEKTSAIYLNNVAEEQNAVKFDKTLQELATCLGGHALMGPLFSYPLLLVEGDDDFIVWSHACRHGLLKFAVIPCNGDELDKYASTLKKIFSSIVEKPKTPLIYKLRDKDIDRSRDVASEDQYLKSLVLNCREIENLYLAKEMLSIIGTDWDRAKEKIKQESVNYGEKRDKLVNLVTDDRRKADIKNLIREIVLILDPKQVDWKIRLAQYLGKNHPEGEIADFLGANVVNSLYGE